MNNASIKLWFCLLCCILVTRIATAKIVTVNFTATVYEVNDPQGFLYENIHPGTILTGSYTYDTNTVDGAESSLQAVYYQASPCRFLISGGNFLFQSDEFYIKIMNNFGGPTDIYSVSTTWGAVGIANFMSSSLDVRDIDLLLEDDTGTAINNDYLTDQAPNLANWPNKKSLVIYGQDMRNKFNIKAQLASLNLAPLTLIYPNGGEHLLIGTETIRWLSDPQQVTGNIKLEYSTNGGTAWSVINTVQNTGSYGWRMPNICSSQCLIRISDTHSGVSDVSDNSFEVQRLGMLKADVNGDCAVNMVDIAYMAQFWLELR